MTLEGLAGYDPFDIDNPRRFLCGHLVEDGDQLDDGYIRCGEDK